MSLCVSVLTSVGLCVQRSKDARIILRLRLKKKPNIRLILEILYSRKDQGNQLHPNEENQGDKSSNNKHKKQQVARAVFVWLVGSVTHLASISSIPSPLTFVALRKRHQEWVKENLTMSFQSSHGEKSTPPKLQGAHLVAFVSSFALQRSHRAFVSHDHELVQLTLEINAYTRFKYTVFVHADSTFSPLPPRSPWKRKDTHQNCHR